MTVILNPRLRGIGDDSAPTPVGQAASGVLSSVNEALVNPLVPSSITGKDAIKWAVIAFIGIWLINGMARSLRGGLGRRDRE